VLFGLRFWRINISNTDGMLAVVAAGRCGSPVPNILLHDILNINSLTNI